MLSNEYESVQHCNVLNHWSAPACVSYTLTRVSLDYSSQDTLLRQAIAQNITMYVNIAPSAEILKSGGEKYGQLPLDKYS